MVWEEKIDGEEDPDVEVFAATMDGPVFEKHSVSSIRPSLRAPSSNTVPEYSSADVHSSGYAWW